MNDAFFKFPSTPHLIPLATMNIRNDKVLSESEQKKLLLHEVTVEEKVDGANLGISFDADGNILAQNRGSYLHLPASGQWKTLEKWLNSRMDSLFEHLTDRYILFGEWCYARHSVYYDRLPDWFLGFDFYDKHFRRFLPVQRRDEIFRSIHIHQVPQIERGIFTLLELNTLLSQLKSKFSKLPVEGLYIRYDQGDSLIQRAKLVCPAFIQSIEQHWSCSGINANRLISEFHI